MRSREGWEIEMYQMFTCAFSGLENFPAVFLKYSTTTFTRFSLNTDMPLKNNCINHAQNNSNSYLLIKWEGMTGSSSL